VEDLKQKTAERINYRCSECHYKLNKNQKKCPKCHSKKIDISLKLKDSFVIHNQIRTKLRKKIDGKNKVIQEQKLDDDYYKKTKKWNYLHRIIDYLNNRYYELIKDGKTGEVINRTDEKLSEHQDHGSAKYKKK
jgi:RNA polymerase subunit RPABC4/transcription elongation factor Spt4